MRRAGALVGLAPIGAHGKFSFPKRHHKRCDRKGFTDRFPPARDRNTKMGPTLPFFKLFFHKMHMSKTSSKILCMLTVELNATDNADAHAGEKVYTPKAF